MSPRNLRHVKCAGMFCGSYAQSVHDGADAVQDGRALASHLTPVAPVLSQRVEGVASSGGTCPP